MFHCAAREDVHDPNNLSELLTAEGISSDRALDRGLPTQAPTAMITAENSVLSSYVSLNSNWLGTNDTRILVMGAHKRARIDYFAVLGSWVTAFQYC